MAKNIEAVQPVDIVTNQTDLERMRADAIKAQQQLEKYQRELAEAEAREAARRGENRRAYSLRILDTFEADAKAAARAYDEAQEAFLKAVGTAEIAELCRLYTAWMDTKLTEYYLYRMMGEAAQTAAGGLYNGSRPPGQPTRNMPGFAEALTLGMNRRLAQMSADHEAAMNKALNDAIEGRPTAD